MPLAPDGMMENPAYVQWAQRQSDDLARGMQTGHFSPMPPQYIPVGGAPPPPAPSAPRITPPSAPVATGVPAVKPLPSTPTKLPPVKDPFAQYSGMQWSAIPAKIKNQLVKAAQGGQDFSGAAWLKDVQAMGGYKNHQRAGQIAKFQQAAPVGYGGQDNPPPMVAYGGNPGPGPTPEGLPITDVPSGPRQPIQSAPAAPSMVPQMSGSVAAPAQPTAPAPPQGMSAARLRMYGGVPPTPELAEVLRQQRDQYDAAVYPMTYVGRNAMQVQAERNRLGSAAASAPGVVMPPPPQSQGPTPPMQRQQPAPNQQPMVGSPGALNPIGAAPVQQKPAAPAMVQPQKPRIGSL